MGRPVKSHTFNGRRYKINIDDLDGWCDQYACNDLWLHILSENDTQKALITTIHEALHAENWAETEEVVERVSREIGTFLWRLGYRKRNKK